MASRDGLSILDAIENLSILIDADSLDDIEITETSQFILHKDEEGVKEIDWVRASQDEKTLVAIRETFHTVHNYLKSFYQRMKQEGNFDQLREGVNTIMILVGEAARKLDTLGELFRQKITDFSEYQNLQNFYRDRIIKELFVAYKEVPLPPFATAQKESVEEETVWEEELQELLGEKEIEEKEGIHLLNDIETVKKDHLYELFYLKNEADQHFYTYALSRAMALACDFRKYQEHYFGEDPLLQIKNWEDNSLHILAQKILEATQETSQLFFKEAVTYKDHPLVTKTLYLMMSLLLAANPRNLLRQFSTKGCHRYFMDALYFLRQIHEERDFQKILLEEEDHSFFSNAITLVEAITCALFTLGAGQDEMRQVLKDLVLRIDKKKEKKLSSFMEQSYSALVETLKNHPDGPLFKAFDLINEEEKPLFDPLMLANIPTRDGEIIYDGSSTTLMRLPSPTHQEEITRAVPLEEFCSFLTIYPKYFSGKYLVVNFQDRTSWQEHARAQALEILANHATYADHFIVVTLAKNTDFYNQIGIYRNLTDSVQFIEQFGLHLADESTGYYFPPLLREKIFPDFVENVLYTIHQQFFKRKKSLSLRERLDFIELAYLFLILKMIEEVTPSFLSLLSKDSLDITGTTTGELFALLGFFQEKSWKEEELDEFRRIVCAPTFLYRERAPLPEHFDRLWHLLKLLDETQFNIKAFAPLFPKGSLKAHLKLFYRGKES